jgi:hypothetical protein
VVSLDDQHHPEQQTLLADSVGLALLVVLETLQPAERLAFVLHDMFAVPYEQIAPIIDRSPAAARRSGRPHRPPRNHHRRRCSHDRDRRAHHRDRPHHRSRCPVSIKLASRQAADLGRPT